MPGSSGVASCKRMLKTGKKGVSMELSKAIYTAHVEREHSDHHFVKPISYITLNVLFTGLGYQQAGRLDGLRYLLSIIALYAGSSDGLIRFINDFGGACNRRFIGVREGRNIGEEEIGEINRVLSMRLRYSIWYQNRNSGVVIKLWDQLNRGQT